ncbi:DUF2218 domain-containing protein [Marinobacter lipolyticus]|uniref:DUF2218 domain-containing protein n=1 Tax=Marinobacter lipolyticus TaxID=209639 RepID=UPI001BCFD9FE|nr:DUF2218 domain-containing protein [Marinobacter lipolyticus]MBS8240354.1 DUF2218 domain-containing protein [Marinobacter lipolyticus]
MQTMIATVATPEPGLLINRLCKHFSHKIEANWSSDTGHLRFSIGECRLYAEGTALTLACQSPTHEELEELGEVVASHLVRFARGHVDQVAWQARGA